MIIKGKSCDYRIVVGLETHAELNTTTKLFSQSKNEFACSQNQNVCLFDIATPGKLPVLNKGVLNKAIAFGIAVNADINKNSRFDRKHYFYPDLPQGYQITQFYEPIIRNGKLKIKLENGKEKTIRIHEAHIEQDAGKLIHDKDATHSYVDYNRSGVPLIEIVTEPDFEDPEEVVVYLKSLPAILRAVDASLADLEKGTKPQFLAMSTQFEQASRSVLDESKKDYKGEKSKDQNSKTLYNISNNNVNIIRNRKVVLKRYFTNKNFRKNLNQMHINNLTESYSQTIINCKTNKYRVCNN